MHPMALYYDNKAAKSIAHYPVQHDQTKHIELNHHFIKELPMCGCSCTPFVKSHDQLADVFTKDLSGLSFSSIVRKLEIIDIYSPA